MSDFLLVNDLQRIPICKVQTSAQPVPGDILFVDTVEYVVLPVRTFHIDTNRGTVTCQVYVNKRS